MPRIRPNGSGPTLIRSDKVGKAKELFTLDELAFIDHEMKAQLKALGSDFLYDKFFEAV